jgi:hypothetical protein
MLKSQFLNSLSEFIALDAQDLNPLIMESNSIHFPPLDGEEEGSQPDILFDGMMCFLANPTSIVFFQSDQDSSQLVCFFLYLIVEN